MKRFLFLLILVTVFSFSLYTPIPNENFEKTLIKLGCDDTLFDSDPLKAKYDL